jgi:hypothetical protein
MGRSFPSGRPETKIPGGNRCQTLTHQRPVWFSTYLINNQRHLPFLPAARSQHVFAPSSLKACSPRAPRHNEKNTRPFSSISSDTVHGVHSSGKPQQLPRSLARRARRERNPSIGHLASFWRVLTALSQNDHLGSDRSSPPCLPYMACNTPNHPTIIVSNSRRHVALLFSAP